MIKKFSIQKGQTLIELLIYMGLLATLLAVLTTIFGSILDVQLESQSLSAVEQDERFVHARLVYDIQRASSITAPSTLGSSSGSLQLVISSTTYTYSLDGSGNVTLNTGSGAQQLNGVDSSISNLQFQRLGNAGGAKPSVRITFTITSRVLRASGHESSNFATTVTTR